MEERCIYGIESSKGVPGIIYHNMEERRRRRRRNKASGKKRRKKRGEVALMSGEGLEI